MSQPRLHRNRCVLSPCSDCLVHPTIPRRDSALENAQRSAGANACGRRVLSKAWAPMEVGVRPLSVCPANHGDAPPGKHHRWSDGTAMHSASVMPTTTQTPSEQASPAAAAICHVGSSRFPLVGDRGAACLCDSEPTAADTRHMILVVRIVHDLPPPWTISYFDLTPLRRGSFADLPPGDQ